MEWSQKQEDDYQAAKAAGWTVSDLTESVITVLREMFDDFYSYMGHEINREDK
jgi:hypothetical protein